MRIIKRVRSVAKFFITQRIKGFPPPQTPMMDGPSLARFRQELAKCRFYLEFGSGGSTVEADRADIPGISVENDPYYHQAVRAALKDGTQIRLCTVDIGTTKGGGRPLFSKPTERRIAVWRRYVEAPFPIIRQQGEFPDFVLVDGRFRVACAIETARQAREMGAATLIMLDDYEGRPHYHELERWLGEPELVGRAAYFRPSAQGESISASAVEKCLADGR